MSDANQLHNRIVWVDIPVADLERACAFYRAVLAIGVHVEAMGDQRFAFFEHAHGNGACLVPVPDQVSRGGALLYHNVEGRLRAAVAAVAVHGGVVVEDVQPIGPHGFRAIVHDSEGNRIALHAMVDA